MDYLDPPPEISVLLLGDRDVGKSTFLSRLSLGYHPKGDELPPYELPTLHDLDQPFAFNVTLYRRPYALNFYDTASPTSFMLLRPDFIILCFDIARRETLHSAREHWCKVVNSHFNHDEALPVMLLGLKRDLRKEWTEEQKKTRSLDRSVMPQEGLLVAQEMLCDRYAECSALTGELCREVLEDVAKMCAKTTTKKGAKSAGPDCVVM